MTGARLFCSICHAPIVAMSEESMKAAAFDHLCFAHAAVRPPVKGEA
jgi:hypothetical protein